MKMLIYQGDLPPSCATPVPEADVLVTLELDWTADYGDCFSGSVTTEGVLGFFRLVDDAGVRHQDSVAFLGVGENYMSCSGYIMVVHDPSFTALQPYMQPILGANCPECFGTGLRGGFMVPCSSPTCKLPIG